MAKKAVTSRLDAVRAIGAALPGVDTSLAAAPRLQLCLLPAIVVLAVCGVSALTRYLPTAFSRPAMVLAGVVVLLAAGVGGPPRARYHYRGWPNRRRGLA